MKTRHISSDQNRGVAVADESLRLRPDAIYWREQNYPVVMAAMLQASPTISAHA
jgi:hypothetical protein